MSCFLKWEIGLKCLLLLTLRWNNGRKTTHAFSVVENVNVKFYSVCEDMKGWDEVDVN